MIHYTEEVVTFQGTSFTPTTDVIHEEQGNAYSNEVKDADGNRFLAFYTQENYDNNDWASPYKVLAVQ